MPRRSLLSMAVMLLLVPALVFAAGGWAVITVDDLPEYLVAGQPTELSFAVRQHGVGLLTGLSASVTAKAGGKMTGVNATAGKGAGRYTAQLVVPEPGEWTVTIQSGFGPSHSVLLPIRAVANGAVAPAPAAPAVRGGRLFVAKGCVGCHVHATIDRASVGPIGPELTGRKYPEAYLSKLLADPASVQPKRPGVTMPNLELRPAEIQALIAFINSDPVAPRK